MTLYPFWGVARLTRLSEPPWQENYIAATGPIFLALIATALGGGLALAEQNVAYPGGVNGFTVDVFLVHLFWANVLLAATALYTRLAARCRENLPRFFGDVSLPFAHHGSIRGSQHPGNCHSANCGNYLVEVAVGCGNGNPALPRRPGRPWHGAASSRRCGTIAAKEAAPAVMVPMDQVITGDSKPTESNFTGFTWNSRGACGLSGGTASPSVRTR